MSSPDPSFHFFHSTRWVVLILSTLCLTLTYSNSLALNFTVICMNDVVEEAKLWSSNDTETVHWLESATDKNMLFSAIAVGSLLGTIPLMTLFEKMGLRYAFLLYGSISTVSTLALPLAVDYGGFWMTALMRVLQGSALAVNFPSLGSICSQWSTLKQSGFYIAILSAHLQFSAMFTMPVAAALCESSYGWRAVFYLQGIISLIGFTIFFIFYTDTPQIHRKVSSKELSRIEKGKENNPDRQRVPYAAIMRSAPIIGVWISSIGGNFGFQIFFQYGPTYMNKVLGLEIASTGWATALPYLLAFLMKFIAGPLSDNTHCISEKAKVILFTSLSQGMMAACFMGLAWTEDATIAQVYYTMAIVFSGLNIVGMVKCAQLVARQHIHFIMAVISFINCFIVLVIPVIVSWFVADNTREQWALLLYFISALVVVTNAYFIFVADAEPAEWTKLDFGNPCKVQYYSTTSDPRPIPELDDDDLVYCTQNSSTFAKNISEGRLQNVLGVENPKVL